MRLNDPTSEPLPTYLRRYAAEVDEWRREAFAARAQRSVAQLHPKDRALFSHIDAVVDNHEH